MCTRWFFMAVCAWFLVTGATAQYQQGHKFSPEKFDAELQQYITKEAALTPQEATKFFPIYKEMQQKQRALFGEQRKLGTQKPSDEKGCEQAIRKRDEIDLELKSIQKKYHDKMLKVIPASKLYDVFKAEDSFHRQKLRNWGHRPWPVTPRNGRNSRNSRQGKP